MPNQINKIGILTSGGDGPGMNAAVRSVVRYALHYGVEVAGIMRGYQGLIDDDIVPMNHRSVSNIINRGGTILKTARSKEFATDEGKAKAAQVLRRNNIDALVVVGGDGSYRGASRLYELHGIPAIGLPGTIDNDLNGTDQTIGCSTAINTALESIDKIRDTAQSMERIFVVEVMGNKSGYIAMEVALAAGAEDVIIPERNFDYEAMHDEAREGNAKGKVSWIIIVSEGAAKAQTVAENITKAVGLETRYVVLGHVQRGGTPSGQDRILATRLGAAAVDLLLNGVYGKAVGVLQDKINVIDLKDATRRVHEDMDRRYELLKILRKVKEREMPVNTAFDVDAIVQKLVMTDDIKGKEALAREIQAQAQAKGIFLASIHDVYIARGKGRGKNFTVPAMNLRSLTYYLARAVFRVAKRLNAGTFIFEIAKSEMGYTNQPPIEYAGVVLAAAIKEGHSGPVFVQGDHCQIKASEYFKDKNKEVSALKDMVADCVAAGFYNIDVDSSTTVKLDRPTLTEQQRDNYEVCADMTKLIRQIQPKGIQISIGGEIGEVGHKNSTVEELVAFMEGYTKSLTQGLDGLSKISVQTGTSHGGTVLPDGTIAKANVDFKTLKDLSAAAQSKFGMGGAVQHGASTLMDDQFNKFPEVNTIEIHLATNFQNKTLDSKLFPKDLYAKMVAWTKANCQSERKATDTDEQFVYKARKRALGQFKKDIMNMPLAVKEGIAAEIEKNFEFLFKQLNVNDTKSFVASIVKPVQSTIGLRHTQAHLDGEGDD